MKAKEIIILILISLAGISFYYVYTGKVFIDFDEVEGLKFTTREKFIFEESDVIEPPLPELLKIVNSHGDIEIFGTKEKSTTILLQKEIWRKKEEQAAEISDKIRMILDQDETKIKITTNREEFPKRDFKTHFRIYLPREMKVEVENSYGLVRISDVKDTSIKNRYGRVIASDINGNLTIQNSYKDVDIENVESNVDLESQYSALFLKNIKGETKIIHKYGKIELENILEKVDIESPYTEIYGQELVGSVEISNSYKNISLFGTGPIKINSYHSTINIERANGNLELYNRYGKARLTDVEGNLTAKGKSFAINGRRIIGDKISISTSYKDIDLIESSGKMIISISHGDLTLEPSTLTFPIDVTGDYANITFFWPRGGEYPFEARTKNGQIKWKLPIDASSGEVDHTTFLKAFLSESEKPLVFLSTTYGNIMIEEID